ncbi:MAG: tetratricopeptide repeat protein, partial [Sphaerospermopsis kisseleviana]
SLGLSIESFLFYQQDGLWKLPEPQLNIAKNAPTTADIHPTILASLRTFSPPDAVNDSGKQWLTYGIQLWRTGNTENAIKAMENAVSKDPNSWESYYNVALILWSKNKYDLALNAMNIAIREQPSFYRSYLLKGFMFQQLKQYENAIEALNQAILEAEKDKQKDFSIYQVRGELLGELKKYQEAIDDYTQAITINPKADYA